MGKVRKTTRQSWNPESMTKAINAVKVGMSYGKASKEFGVDKTTLQRRVKGGNKIATGSTKMLGSMRSVMPKVFEDELFDYCLKMEERLFGLTCEDLRELAYELAERNGVKHPFNKETKKAGWAWLSGFRRRYPRLSLRSPENTSAARARGFNPQNVKSFFDLYKDVMEKENYPPHRIFNVDEKGVSTVPNHVPKIIAMKGRKQVGTIASGEKGQTTTTIICGNALGNFVPPLFIFPRVKPNHDLMRGAPQGSIQQNFKTGWIQKEIFITWLKHFISFTGSTKENPSLLILDGHSTHTKSIQLIDIARDSGVTIICLPPHTTHRMQPLDVTVMKPLSVGLAKASRTWLSNNVGHTLGLYQVAEIFALAYEKATVPSHLINGFAKCGIYPINSEIFADKFAASAVSEIPLEVDEEIDDGEENLPENVSEISIPVSSAVSNHVTPSDIKPLPQVDATVERSKRSGKKSGGKAAILTSSPYLKELTKDEEIERLRKELKETKKALRAARKEKPCQRNLFPEQGEGSVIKIGNVKKGTKKKEKSVLKIKKEKCRETKIKKEKTKELAKNEVLNKATEALAEEVTLDINPGQFILVSFSGDADDQPSSSKVKSVYYVGHVTKIVSDTEVETKFLRRVDLRKSDNMRFAYPDEGDLATHHLSQIVALLPKPKMITGKSERRSSTFSFDCPDLTKFSPVL